MTSNNSDRRPFSMPYVAHGTLNIGNSATQMIARAPWPAPVGKYFVLRKLVATATQATSGSSLTIWDQDLSNTTPVGRGSGGGPLITVPIIPFQPGGGSGNFITNVPTMTVLDFNACTQEYFQAGFTVGSPLASGIISITAEFDVI